jgi:type I restriction enzyme S subunit
MFALYSMPAYDVNMRPEIVPGREIGSAKRKTYANDCLFSRLNPRIPRVWIVDEHEEQAVCSTDFITL